MIVYRIPCCGFLFREKPKLRNIKNNVIGRYNIPVDERHKIKRGEDYKMPNGEIIKNSELTIPPPPLRSYAYCSDTAYSEAIIPQVSNVDLLYHETTFMNDMLERAEETYHSTTIQAATIAKKAKVKQLIIGHFSARYKDMEPLLRETRSVFENTVLAEEGKLYEV